MTDEGVVRALVDATTEAEIHDLRAERARLRLQVQTAQANAEFQWSVASRLAKDLVRARNAAGVTSTVELLRFIEHVKAEAAETDMEIASLTRAVEQMVAATSLRDRVDQVRVNLTGEPSEARLAAARARRKGALVTPVTVEGVSGQPLDLHYHAAFEEWLRQTTTRPTMFDASQVHDAVGGADDVA